MERGGGVRIVGKGGAKDWCICVYGIDGGEGRLAMENLE